MIRVVLLAAGESKRMGRPKLLLPFGNSTIIETVVSTALSASIDEVLLVLGAWEERIRQRIAHMPVTLAINTEYRSGMLSSIQCGFRHLPADTEAAVILLGDQPEIPVRVIDMVIDAWRVSGKGLVVPVCAGRRGHPLLVDMCYRDEVRHLDAALGLRALLSAHGDDVHEIEVPVKAILKDIDTPQDYSELTARVPVPPRSDDD